jgi:hypothetical protein
LTCSPSCNPAARASRAALAALAPPTSRLARRTTPRENASMMPVSRELAYTPALEP